MRQHSAGRAPCGYGIRLVKKEDGILICCGAEYARDVFRSLADPHRLRLSVVHNEKLHAESMRDSFGANRFTCARESGEVERQATPRSVTLAETPVAKN